MIPRRRNRESFKRPCKMNGRVGRRGSSRLTRHNHRPRARLKHLVRRPTAVVSDSTAKPTGKPCRYTCLDRGGRIEDNSAPCCNLLLNGRIYENEQKEKGSG